MSFSFSDPLSQRNMWKDQLATGDTQLNTWLSLTVFLTAFYFLWPSFSTNRVKRAAGDKRHTTQYFAFSNTLSHYLLFPLTLFLKKTSAARSRDKQFTTLLSHFLIVNFLRPSFFKECREKEAGDKRHSQYMCFAFSRTISQSLLFLLALFTKQIRAACDYNLSHFHLFLLSIFRKKNLRKYEFFFTSNSLDIL